jgi:hypothetical protein
VIGCNLKNLRGAKFEFIERYSDIQGEEMDTALRRCVAMNAAIRKLKSVSGGGTL